MTNSGPSDAQNVQVNDVLPAGLLFIGSSGCDNDPNGNPICNLGTIAAGAFKAFNLTATVDASIVNGTIIDRITSYNVCYTKLLRIVQQENQLLLQFMSWK